MAEDIVRRLLEPILVDAFERGEIGGKLAERLIHERNDAAEAIIALRRELTDADERARKKYAPCD